MGVGETARAQELRRAQEPQLRLKPGLREGQ
jgi:hypothetical protein